jgi:hypothetical protein
MTKPESSFPSIKERAALALTVLLLLLFSGCNEPSAFARSVEARQLATTLQAEFTRAVDASNRAVMAKSDDASAEFVREAKQKRQQIKRTEGELVALLRELQYSDELKLVEDFHGKFAAYEVLDANILELSVENTNVKAMRHSFGSVSEAANAFKQAVSTLATPCEACRARVLTLEAIGAVREIQALEAPHIAEASDARMAQIEEQMAKLEVTAKSALSELSGIVGLRESQAAVLALDHFAKANAEVIALSRRNTNVRSLEMTLGQKRVIIATCEESLRALREAFIKRNELPTR